MTTYRLSKTRFQTGMQCRLALWLTMNEPDLADVVSDQQQHIFDTGTSVGELARERFAGGVLVEEDHRHSAEALATTRRLMADPPAAIYEAAFEHGSVFVRPDVLVRNPDGSYDLFEVKSGTKVKPVNITDVAVQTWVLQGAGLTIRRAHLVHLDNTYVYEGGDYDLQRLFAAEDITDDVRAWLPRIPALVAEMLESVAGSRPEVRIGRHCDSPYSCAYHGHCHEFLPEYPVTNLPRVNESLLASLIDDELYCAADVPTDYPGLSPAQREVCELLRTREARLIGDVSGSLAGLEYPVHFLDFETLQSALPLYAGSSPWQQVPFQWSDHVMHADGAIDHLEFLYEGDGDPRSEFTATLVEALADTGTVVVYTAFENTQLGRLAEALPERAAAISAIQRRLFDLEKVVRKHVRHPDCMGRTSIKVVLPALVDDLSYDNLGIRDGSAASRLYLAAATGQLTDDECTALFADLRDYCGTDTMAMVRLYEVLEGGEL